MTMMMKITLAHWSLGHGSASDVITSGPDKLFLALIIYFL